MKKPLLMVPKWVLRYIKVRTVFLDYARLE